MNPNHPLLSRVWLWPLAIALAATGLIASSFLARSAATARSLPPTKDESKTEGVVCFGTVDLEHGVASLSPLQPGRVIKVVVRENQAVEAGDELIRLDDRAARSRLAEAEASLKLSRSRLDQARKLPAQRTDRIGPQEAALKAVRSRLEAARQVLSQRQKTVQATVVSSLEIAASQVEVSEIEAQERAEAQRLAELKHAEDEADAAIDRAELEVAAAQARRDEAQLALDECLLKAPSRGTVLRIGVAPGDVLGAQRVEPALLFAADGPQVVRATVEQEFAPRIEEGMPAVVENEADPSATWRGRVERLAGWYSQRRSVLHSPSQMSDVRTLECVIVLDSGQPRLRLGQSVRVRLGNVPH